MICPQLLDVRVAPSTCCTYDIPKCEHDNVPVRDFEARLDRHGIERPLQASRWIVSIAFMYLLTATYRTNICWAIPTLLPRFSNMIAIAPATDPANAEYHHRVRFRTHIWCT